MSDDAERRRREFARERAGDVVEGSGEVVQRRRLDHMVSVRLEPDLVTRLRDIATATGVSLSDLLRRGAALVVDEDARTYAPVVQLRVIQGDAAAGSGSTTSNRSPVIEPRSQTL